MALRPFLGPWTLLSFLIVYTVGKAPWTSISYLHTGQHEHKITQTSMHRVWFKPTIPVFERWGLARGRVVAQAVNRRLFTAAAWVRAHVRSCGICGGESEIRAGFLRMLRIPLPLISPAPPHSSSSIIRDSYSRPNSSRHTKWTQSHSDRKKRKRKPESVRAGPAIEVSSF
jgi:hypothetical protein